MMGGRNEMTVKASTKDLLNKMRRNRETHLEAYKLALKRYKELGAEALQKKLKEFEAFTDNSPKAPVLNFSALPLPQCYVKEYDRHIGMLELHQDETILLDMDSYRKFWEDEWDWKHTWAATNSAYFE